MHCRRKYVRGSLFGLGLGSSKLIGSGSYVSPQKKKALIWFFGSSHWTSTRIDGCSFSHYLYTADDERILRFGNDGFHWTLRDFGGRLLREFRPEADRIQPIRDHIYRGSGLLATVNADGSGNLTQVRHQSLDHLGSPRYITDSAGNFVSEHKYYPFGEEATRSTQDDLPLKFTGHERDFNGVGQEDDLDYMHARFCDPRLGRFLSVDPARSGHPEDPQSWNRYTYARNASLNLVDPNGETVESALETIREHRTEIAEASRSVNGKVSELLIARLVFQENRNDFNLIRNMDASSIPIVGGPGIKNTFSRSAFLFSDRHGSFGIVEMGTQVAARLLGFSSRELTGLEKSIIDAKLNDPNEALKLGAKELARIKKAFPNATDTQILNAYNRGDKNIQIIGAVGLRSAAYLKEIRELLEKNEDKE